MTTLDDEVAVIRLACLTEDRTDAEQRALLRLARRADRKWNAVTVTNTKTWERSIDARDGQPVYVLRRDLLQLEDEVDRSRVLSDNQKPVKLPDKGRWTLDRSIRCYDGRGRA